MEYFIDTVDTIVDGVGFNYFDSLHLAWIAVFVVFAVFMSVIYRKADVQKRDKIRKIMALSIVLNEVWKVFWLVVGGNYAVLIFLLSHFMCLRQIKHWTTSYMEHVFQGRWQLFWRQLG